VLDVVCSCPLQSWGCMPCIIIMCSQYCKCTSMHVHVYAHAYLSSSRTQK
jgi:hypothetical protein